MNKRFIFILSFFCLVALQLCADTTPAAKSVSKEEADSAYAEGNYQKAIALYDSLLQQGVSTELYYNFRRGTRT